MATITISADTYLDDAARTAGDTYSVTGGTFKIRTDTRWHANAPASMTGTIGNVTGNILIDGTAVRHIAFDTGSGNVPAIGTSITQGEVSGYLLAVYANYQSAPTAVGAAMPASGYIKFREVTGGTFSAGALTGIGANALGADTTGWIEVVFDAGTTITGAVVNNGIQVRGAWFELGTTNGSRGQTFQVPTNGGGANTHVYGVQIETAPGSGVYEWYATASTSFGSANWNTTNLSTDARSKYVESMGTGQIRIGSNGTNDIGYLPASGCKVRIPNIFGRTAATASRAVNLAPGGGTRPTLAGGNYDIDIFHFDYQFSNSMGSKIKLKNTCWEYQTLLQDTVDPVVIDNVLVGSLNSFTSGVMLQLQRTAGGGTVTNLKVVQPSGLSANPLAFSYISDFTMTGITAECCKAKGSISGGALKFTSSKNITVDGVSLKGDAAILNYCDSISISNTDYVDRIEAITNSTGTKSVYTLTGCTNMTFSGLTFGLGGTIANTQCYNSIFSSTTAPNKNVKIRNIGTKAAPLDAGATSTIAAQYIYSCTSGDSFIKIQRCYFTNLKSGLISGLNLTTTALLVEEVYGSYTQAIGMPGRDSIYRKISAPTSSTYSNSSSTGVHWADYFDSATTGFIRWFCQPFSTDSAAYNTLNMTQVQGAGFSPLYPSLSIITQGDYIISETPYWIKGHTGLRNVAPSFYGQFNNISQQYDIDTGSGFSGTWKTINAANLSAETVPPSGFKLRIKMTNTAGNANIGIQGLTIYTSTSSTAQSDNLFQLDTNSLTFTGLATGSEVRCYVGTDPSTATEVSGVESTSGSTFTLQHSAAGSIGFITILAMGYQPIYFPYTYKSVDDSILIQPVIDRNYNNPV